MASKRIDNSMRPALAPSFIRSTTGRSTVKSFCPTIRSDYYRSIMSSHPEQVPHRRRRLQVIFRRKTEERRIFMEELNEMRLRVYKENYAKMRKAVGPEWYQVFSVVQQAALDCLESAIYYDLLEGVSKRVMRILKALGIVPRPRKLNVLKCMYIGRDDPKAFLAYLFEFMFGHDFSYIRDFGYPSNGRIILSAIYYLGKPQLIEFLEEKFKPEEKKPVKRWKKPPKTQIPLKSPYLQDLETIKVRCPPPKPRRPKPLPNLDFLNEKIEDDTMKVQKPPPPAPPPPPPKKRLVDPDLCDKAAGYFKIKPSPPKVKATTTKAPKKPTPLSRGSMPSKLCLFDIKKKEYGIKGLTQKKKVQKKPKIPVIPDLPNMQYAINGVRVIGDKLYYILSGVSILPGEGELKHGGHTYIEGDCFRIHDGVVINNPIKPERSCHCLEKYKQKVRTYVNETKCRCGHYYDYNNDGNFYSDDPPYFEKPTATRTYKINHDTIYEMDQKMYHIKRETQKIWETESVLQDEECKCEVPVSSLVKKTIKKKDLVQVPSSHCLSGNPKVEDYLRCALRLQRKVNLAARLPDIHLAVELKDWMRRRIYGTYGKTRKRKSLKRSLDCWVYLKALQKMGLGKVYPERKEIFTLRNTWKNKYELQKKFAKLRAEYRLKIFRAHLFFNNLFWSTMGQAQYPDKRFRDIFFCYLISKASDVYYIHPYDKFESNYRMLTCFKRPYKCLPDGVKDVAFPSH